MSERLWFQTSVEGLLIRGVGERLTPALAKELKGLGVDVAKLEPAYSAEVMQQVITRSAAALFPQHSPEERLRELGHLFMQGFGQTLIGMAMVQFMKVIGPRRSLERMQRNFRTGSNYIETKFTHLDEHTAQVWFNDVSGIPGFYAGIIEEGGRTAGAHEVSVTWELGTGADCTFTVSFR